jgi:hypothetical protein
MEAGSKLAIEIGHTGSSPFGNLACGRMLVAGSATIAGDLDVAFVDLGNGAYTPHSGDRFSILLAGGGLDGTFDSIHLPVLPAGLIWDMQAVQVSWP